jgi:hypothetical protein
VHGRNTVATKVDRVVYKINPIISKATQAFDEENSKNKFHGKLLILKKRTPADQKTKD